jgi:hypothetical protein
MRFRAGVLTVALVTVGCGEEPPARSGSTPSTSVSVTTSIGPEPSRNPEPSPSPAPEAGAMPTTFTADLAPSELPPRELIPTGADVTGEWFAFTDRGAALLIAWVEPGTDYSRLPRGFAVWRHFDAEPHWRTSLITRHDPEDGIQEIQIATGDLTGDGSDDALVFEGIGGSGACGRWSVVDLDRVEETYRRDVCDGRIEPGPPGSPGLVLTESVYRQGDAHCCPSAIRRTTLIWTGTTWRVMDRTLVEG